MDGVEIEGEGLTALAVDGYFTLRMLEGDLRIVDREAIESAQSVAESLQAKIDSGELKFNLKGGSHGA